MPNEDGQAAAGSMPVRRATEADVAGLARLAAAAFGAKFGPLYPAAVLEAYLAKTYSEASTAALVSDPASAVWVAGHGTALSGYAVLAPCRLPHAGVTAACLELRRLYTAPDATGTGVGTRLMEAVVMPAMAAAAARGGDGWIGVYSGNDGAQRFYARWGFEQVGEYEFPVGPVRDREFILRRRHAEGVIAER